MSERADDLAAKVTDAINEWLAETGGGMATAYALAVNYYDNEGEPCWSTASADEQTPAHTLGLLRWHTLHVEHDVASYFDPEDDQ